MGRQPASSLAAGRFAQGHWVFTWRMQVPMAVSCMSPLDVTVGRKAHAGLTGVRARERSRDALVAGAIDPARLELRRATFRDAGPARTERRPRCVSQDVRAAGAGVVRALVGRRSAPRGTARHCDGARGTSRQSTPARHRGDRHRLNGAGGRSVGRRSAVALRRCELAPAGYREAERPKSQKRSNRGPHAHGPRLLLRRSPRLLFRWRLFRTGVAAPEASPGTFPRSPLPSSGVDRCSSL